MKNEKSKFILKEKSGNFDFENLKLDENGKFINDKTKIEIDKEQGIVTFTNVYPNGETQKMTLKLKDKK